MQSHQTNYGSNQFWADVQERLTPTLGNIKAKFGRLWMDRFVDHFNRADFLELAMAKQTNGQGPDWFLIELHQEAASLIDEDAICAATSPNEAIAYLAARCLETGIWPSEATLYESACVIELKLNNNPFATIKPLPKTIANNEANLTRAKNTLHGLRKNADCLIELTKRAREWPGLSFLDHTDARKHYVLDSDFHLPTPAEWLLSAKKIAEAAGMGKISTAQAQQLAAAALGEPSWNHLCGYFQKKTAAAPLSWPWYVSSKWDGLPSEEYTPFVNLYDAFASFLMRSRELVNNTEGWQICTSETFQRMPFFTLKQLHTPNHIKQHLPTTKLCLMPIRQVSAGESWTKRVNELMATDTSEGLHDLFQIDRNSIQRQKHRAQTLGRTLLAQDAGWLFTLDGEGDARYLYAEMIDEMGNKVGEAAVTPTYKGELKWDKKFNAHILSCEYDGRGVIAMIKGISEATRKTLLSHLSVPHPYRDELFPLEKEDAQRLDRMVQKMSHNGATYGH